MRIVSFLIIFFAFATISLAEKVKIYGTAQSYARSNLNIKYHSEAFTYAEKKICDFPVNEDGQFSVEFEIKKSRLVFLPLGIYKGFLYLEPGKEYELKLPLKKELSPAQKLNPFFEAEELMIGVANIDTNKLNLMIRKLDDKLDAFINQNFHKIYRKKDKSVGIDFANQIKEEFNAVQNQFFKDYLHYRLGFMEFLAYPNAFRKIEEKYFVGKEIQLNNPAYMSLYKKQYGNFLNGFFSQKESPTISAAFKSKNTYQEIFALMNKYPAYENIQFRNLIIATSIFDSYSRKFIGRKKALEIFTQIKKSSGHDYTKELCANFIAKITHLQKDYPAPNFSIGDHQLANYKGKYLYLNFCNTQSYPCLQDFKEIQKLKQQFGQHIEFLSIACDWDESRFEQFAKTNQYDWPIIHIGDQHQLIQQYNVKAFPIYVLIDPEGNIVDATAPGPKENIQMQFIKIARDALRKAYQK